MKRLDSDPEKQRKPLPPRPVSCVHRGNKKKDTSCLCAKSMAAGPEPRKSARDTPIRQKFFIGQTAWLFLFRRVMVYRFSFFSFWALALLLLWHTVYSYTLAVREPGQINERLYSLFMGLYERWSLSSSLQVAGTFAVRLEHHERTCTQLMANTPCSWVGGNWPGCGSGGAWAIDYRCNR